MNFGTPKQIADTLQAGDEVNRVRSANRTLVNNAFNGLPYLDDATAKRWKLDTNWNTGEAPVLAAHARRQYDNAVLGSQNYFKVALPKAPEEKKSSWGSFITNFINDVMKESQEYTCLKEYQISSVVSHGPGIQTWRDADNWLPDFVAIEDFRVATDTRTDFKGMMWFAERHDYSPGELSTKVFGKNADSRWDKKAIAKILHEYDDINFLPAMGDWHDLPEKRAEAWKQSLGYFSSDKQPSISLYNFFYYDDTDPMNCFWRLCVIPDYGENAPKGVDASNEKFLYDSGDKPFASKLEHLLNVQFGDLNTKSPFMFYSQRSLGMLLYEPCFWNNLALCRQLQYLMESFNPWFRVEDPNDRARVQKIDLAGQSVLEKGVSIVPNTERHQVNPQLIESVMAKLKQLQSEASQSYTQSTDTGTAREQTAFETRVKLSAVNAMMTGLLGRFFRKEVHAYREICRRFCLSKSSNKDVQDFQKACEREGIPRVWLNVEHWKIEPEVPLGSGNPTMAMTSVQELMGLYPYLNPTAQGEVIHEAIEVYTNDPRKADRWQPIGRDQGLSAGKEYASAMFGTLMTGVPPPIKEEVPPPDLIEVWLGMMAGMIHLIEVRDNVGTAPELIGLQNVESEINKQIQRLSQIQSQKQKVKQYGDSLGQLTNIWKGFAQRLAEKNAQSNGDPEAQAKIQALLATTQAKLHGKALSDKQKMETSRIKFESEQHRKDVQLAADLQRDQIASESEIQNETMKTGAEIAQSTAKTHSDIKNQKKKADQTPKSKPKE